MFWGPEAASPVCHVWRERRDTLYEEALQYFLRTTNITDAMDHFADIAQRKLPFTDEEPNP
jgi:hypothetical protein